MDIRNADILLAAVIVERLSFYMIIPRRWVVVSGLLYVRLGVRYARILPHAGTTLFAGGALMISYPISEVFALLGLFIASVAIAIIGIRLLKRDEGILLAVAKLAGIVFFWAYPFAMLAILRARERL